MNESKYMLTYDFRILYCPNMKLRLSCKELNYKTMEFIKYDDDLSLLDYYIELNKADVDLIITTIFNGVIGIELSEEDMNWLKTFDSLLEEDLSIIYNKKLAFNYSVLKLKLIGFSEDVALKIATKQFLNQELYPKYPHYTVFLDKINEILDRRDFWISNKIDSYREAEIDYLRTVLNYKNRLKYKFDYSVFKNEYLKLIEKSFMPHLIQYNSEHSYLIRRVLNFEKQIPFLEKSYKYVIIEILNALMLKEYPQLLLEESFFYDLVEEMYNVVNLYLNILLQKEKEKELNK